MNAPNPIDALLLDTERTEAASLRRRLEATQVRLDAEIQRCGRAEGREAVLRHELERSKAREATLTESLRACRAELGDLRDRLDEYETTADEKQAEADFSADDGR